MIVELIHPPHYNSTDDRLDPPLGLLILSSYLKNNLSDVEVRVNDLSGISESDWKIGYADLYGITSYVTSIKTVYSIAYKCKEINNNSFIAVGGAHPTAVPEDFDDFPFDFIVRGEGEVALAYIVEILKNEFYDDDIFIDKVVSGKSIDDFYFPDFNSIDLDSYHRKIDGMKSVPLLTTRGCIYKCAFCGLNSMHKFGTKIRHLRSKQLGLFISNIMKDYGVRAINFQDDMFTLNRILFKEKIDKIGSFGIKFRCHGRAGYDTEETYKLLSKAGCSTVSWGIESGSQFILDRMNKNVSVEDNYNVISWAKKYGITTRAFFVIGFPGETKDTLEETKRFIEKALPDQYFVSNFVPYPGTEVWKNPSKYGVTYLDTNFDNYYQVSKDGTGGLTIDTEWLSRNEFRKLELDFRDWMKNHIKRRGYLQDYEIYMENK